ncbi:MAG: response regulator [Candidatus Sumerlaeota bacterium]|nr:response regulator [Candidatus Sumerlaeota bacterium]
MPAVLIIDDDPQFRYMLAETFRDEGFEVDEAPDGKKGLRAYRAAPSDIVIVDMIMPEQEGVETIMAFRKEFPAVPIIAISGGGRLSPLPYLELALQFGAARVFTKPFDRKQFLAAVRELLDPEPHH